MSQTSPALPPQCQCGLTAVIRTCGPASKNPGKQFYSCSKPMASQCKFFQWLDAPRQPSASPAPAATALPQASFVQQQFSPQPSSSIASQYPVSQQTHVQQPSCPKHNVLMQRRISNSAQNPGRPYYTCPAERNCTFKWEDELAKTQQASSFSPQVGGTSPYAAGAAAMTSPQHAHGDLPVVTLSLVSHPLDRSKPLHQQREVIRVSVPSNIAASVAASLQSIANRISGKDNTEWFFPVQQHKLIISTLSSRRYPVSINDVHQKAIDLLNQYQPLSDLADAQKGVDWAWLPEHLRSALKPYQCQGITFGMQKNGRVMLADEMGLGKSIQAIALSYFYRGDWPLLIVCPSSLRYNWQKEVEKWLYPFVNASDIRIATKGTDKLDKLVNIISYDLITRGKEPKAKAAAAATVVDDDDDEAGEVGEGLKDSHFKVVICDECHFLKNSKAQRTQKLLPLIQKADRAILLTGTPALSRPIELFTQMQALLERNAAESVWFSKRDFQFRYCAGRWIVGYSGTQVVDDKGASNLDELNLLLCRTVMIRRLKRDVLTDLPNKSRQCVYVQVPKKKAKELEADIKKYKKEREALKTNGVDPIQGPGKDKTSHNDYMKAYLESGKAKIDAIDSYIHDLVESEVGKFIVFAHHKEVMDAIEKACKKHLGSSKSYVRIDGSTALQKREYNVVKFDRDYNCLVAILSLKAAGVGLNMTKASLVVFAELGFTPGDMLQAEDRAHRIGQQNDVIVRYIIGEGTLDTELWAMLQRKLDITAQALDAKQDVAAGFVNTKLQYDSKNKHTEFHTMDEYLLRNISGQAGAASSSSPVVSVPIVLDDGNDQSADSKHVNLWATDTGYGDQQQRYQDSVPSSSASSEASSSDQCLGDSVVDPTVSAAALVPATTGTKLPKREPRKQPKSKAADPIEQPLLTKQQKSAPSKIVASMSSSSTERFRISRWQPITADMLAKDEAFRCKDDPYHTLPPKETQRDGAAPAKRARPDASSSKSSKAKPAAALPIENMEEDHVTGVEDEDVTMGDGLVDDAEDDGEDDIIRPSKKGKPSTNASEYTLNALDTSFEDEPHPPQFVEQADHQPAQATTGQKRGFSEAFNDSLEAQEIGSALYEEANSTVLQKKPRYDSYTGTYAQQATTRSAFASTSAQAFPSGNDSYFADSQEFLSTQSFMSQASPPRFGGFNGLAAPAVGADSSGSPSNSLDQSQEYEDFLHLLQG